LYEALSFSTAWTSERPSVGVMQSSDEVNKSAAVAG
jgi:hypothetical protein